MSTPPAEPRTGRTLDPSGTPDTSLTEKTLTTKSVLRYPGGKSRAVKKLASIIPDYLLTDDKHAVAPFFGGGSFELWLTSTGKRVYGLDLFYCLTAFWQQCAASPRRLADRLTEIRESSITATEFKAFQESLRTAEAEHAHGDNEHMLSRLEIAARFYAVNRCSFSGSTLSGGFSKSAAKDRFTESSIQRIRDWHNPLVDVDYGDVFTLLDDALDADTGPTVLTNADLLFLDPPYMLGGSRDKLYGDRGNTHEGFDHQQLCEKVRALTADNADMRVLLTYNDSPEIRDMYRDFTITEAEWAYGMNASKKSSEIFIHNF